MGFLKNVGKIFVIGLDNLWFCCIFRRVGESC